MVKKEIQPCTTPLCEVCKQIYDKNKEGVNSLQTLNPDGHIKCYCAKLNWPVDAVAKAEHNIDPYLANAISLVRWLNAFVNKFY